MSNKTIKIVYWVLILLFVAFSLFDGIGGIMHQAKGVEGVTHLGYPIYLMDIAGTAKIIGALCILQTRFKAIKEWAYAGFAISFISAAWSHIYMGDSVAMISMPAGFLVFMFITYYFWKRYETVK